jgi:tRNA(Arg) A34 adenosine deaminase TadA
MESRDLAMMRRALELAREAAARGEVPVGAVIYREDEVVAEAANDREATRCSLCSWQWRCLFRGEKNKRVFNFN